VSRVVQQHREIAFIAMFEGTSAERVKRAVNSNTRLASETFDLTPCDVVAFGRSPMQGQLMLCSLNTNLVLVVRAPQGHIYQRLSRHVRRALTSCTVVCSAGRRAHVPRGWHFTAERKRSWWRTGHRDFKENACGVGLSGRCNV